MSDFEEAPQPEPANMAWLLTFADLVSLLITFFVLLYSMKVVSSQTWDELVGSFQGAFTIRKQVHKLKPDQTDTVEKIDLARSDDLEYIRTILSRYFSENILLHDVRLIYDPQSDVLNVHIPSQKLFDSGQENIAHQGKTTLIALGDLLRHLDNRIEVAGHTSAAFEESRRYPSAWELSMLRALQVGNVLKEQGVTRVLTLSGYADSRHPASIDNGKIQLDPDRVNIMIHGEK